MNFMKTKLKQCTKMIASAQPNWVLVHPNRAPGLQIERQGRFFESSDYRWTDLQNQGPGAAGQVQVSSWSNGTGRNIVRERCRSVAEARKQQRSVAVTQAATKVGSVAAARSDINSLVLERAPRLALSPIIYIYIWINRYVHIMKH